MKGQRGKTDLWLLLSDEEKWNGERILWADGF